MKPWKTLNSKMAFDHRWFKVRQDEVQLPNGNVLDDYFVWVNEDVSMVVPFTEEGKFVMVQQYKHGAGKVVLEFPAGFVHKDEDPQIGALRELEEETGYLANSLIHLATFTNDPTKTTAKIHIYLAKNTEKNGKIALDISEEIETLLLTPSEVFAKLLNNEIVVTASALAVLLALEKLRLFTFQQYFNNCA